MILKVIGKHYHSHKPLYSNVIVCVEIVLLLTLSRNVPSQSTWGHTVHSGILRWHLLGHSDLLNIQSKIYKKKTTTHRHPGKILELDTNFI